MPTYVMLGNFTQQGMQRAKDLPQRQAAAQEAAKALGMTWRGAFLTMGRYDVVAIFDAPDDETMAKFALQTGMRGNLATETLRAFETAEIEALLEAL